MKKRFFALMVSLSLLLGTTAVPGAAESKTATNPAPNVIPAVREWVGSTGQFTLKNGMRMVLTGNATLSEQRKSILSGYFATQFDMEVPVVQGTAAGGDILLVKQADASLGKDGYILDVQSDRVTVKAPDEIGLMYGVITVLQSCIADGYVPCGVAKDYSAYEVRGGMLDVARAWIPMDYLTEISRYLAWFKINQLHIHVSDNNAFRLESDVPNLSAEDGYYTKAEYRDYQKLMLDYGVEIITEIDTPAHSGCFRKAIPADYMLSDGYHLNIENPAVLPFIKSLLDEYLKGDDPVIVSTRFHIGTDEYPSGHNEQMRAYTDELLRYVRSLGYTPRFWGSFGGTGFNGNTPVTGDAEANYWATSLSDYNVLLSMGYDLINTCGPVLYVVPGGNYGFADYYNLEKLYNTWQVNYLGINSSSAIDPNHKQLLGGSFALWNDLWGEMSGFSVQDIFDRLRGQTCLMAEKTWCGQQTASMEASDFLARYDALSLYGGDADPGRHMTDTIDGTVPEGTVGFGYPYIASADVKVGSASGETVLFDGPDGTFFVSADGTPGFRRGKYTFTYPCKLDGSQTTHIELVADPYETLLVIDGTYYYEPINHQNAKLTRSSSFVLPLKTVSSAVSNLHVERASIDKQELLATGNYALNKPTSVSGLEVTDGRFSSELAVDGDVNTRLSFARDKDEQWLLIDLETVRTVNRVEIQFFEHISDYSISVSMDGTNFTEVARVRQGTDQAKQLDTVTFDPVQARYIRYEQHKRFYISAWNAYYSGGISELRVFGYDPNVYQSLVKDAEKVARATKSDAVQKACDELKAYLTHENVFTSHLNALVTALTDAVDGALPKGDVTGDGTLNAADYLLLKRHVLRTLPEGSKLTEKQIKRGDVTNDGKTNASDYFLIKRSILSKKPIE